jgi:carbonic anhydrase
VACRNVEQVVRDIRSASNVLESLVKSGRLAIVGMLYDVASGVTRVVPGTVIGLPEDASRASPTSSS